MKKQFIVHYSTCHGLIQSGVSDDCLLAYIALKSMSSANMTEIPVHFESLHYQMYGNFIQNKNHKNREYNRIKSALQELESVELVKIIKEENKIFILDLSGLLEVPSGANHFAILELDKIHAAIREKSKKIIRYLLILLDMKNQNNNNWFFMSSRELIADECEINVKTVDLYNEMLEKCKILYIYRYDGYRYRDSVNKVSNCYGLYRDKQKIIEECEKYLKRELLAGRIQKRRGLRLEGLC